MNPFLLILLPGLLCLIKKIGHEETVRTGKEFHAGHLAKVIQVTEDLQQEALRLLEKYNETQIRSQPLRGHACPSLEGRLHQGHSLRSQWGEKKECL